MAKKEDYTKGLNFWKWLFSGLSIAVMFAWLLFTIVIIAERNTFYEVEWFWISLAFIQTIAIIFTYKTWQYWNDMKNGRNR